MLLCKFAEVACIPDRVLIGNHAVQRLAIYCGDNIGGVPLDAEVLRERLRRWHSLLVVRSFG